jgi:hypothetical protein
LITWGAAKEIQALLLLRTNPSIQSFSAILSTHAQLPKTQ